MYAGSGEAARIVYKNNVAVSKRAQVLKAPLACPEQGAGVFH